MKEMAGTAVRVSRMSPGDPDVRTGVARGSSKSKRGGRMATSPLQGSWKEATWGPRGLAACSSSIKIKIVVLDQIDTVGT